MSKTLEHHRILLDRIETLLADLPKGSRILDAGCGEGLLSGKMASLGYSVTGIDIDGTAISQAQSEFPDVRFLKASVEDSALPALMGQTFDLIFSAEVIEHLFSPVAFVKNCKSLLTDKGQLILTTPHHGYLKNLTIALVGRTDQHYSPIVEGGHIKFWSLPTLRSFLAQHGFEVRQVSYFGRIPFFWKSMILKAQKKQ